MKVRKQRLTMLFVLICAAVLSLAAVFSFHTRSVAAGVQDQAQSDVKAPVKGPAKPRIPGVLAPTNDSCANAISVNDCPFTDTRDTSGATTEEGEPAPCGLIGSTVWYTLANTTPNRVVVSIDTCASNYDTVLALYQVDAAQPCNFASFVQVACNDDTCGLQSKLVFTAQPGQTYKLQAGGFDGDTGSLTLAIDCQELFCDDIVVNGHLGLGSPDHPFVTGQQTPNRIFRDGVPSTCAAPKTCPGTFGSGSFTFDAYTFTNESNETQCVTVQFRPNVGCATNVHSVTYLGSYVPTNVCLNYLADVGSSTDLDYSFEVPAGEDFVVVIAANNPGGVGNGCAYQFTVVGNICEQFDFCVQDDNIPGRFIKINSTTGAYEYHDCAKGVVLTGTGSVSTYFCKIQLFDSGPDPKRPDRSVSVLVNPCTGRGDASVRVPGSTTTATIRDSNITNNTCACP